MTAFSPLKTSLRLALAAFLTLTEDGLISLQDGRKRLAVNRFMLGNFAPQPHEAFAAHLPITGTLPDELVGGVYARIGPNPTFIAGNYHWFDGDGYVHAVRLGEGHANYSGSFVQTSRYTQERAAGRALFSKFGDCSGPAAMGHVIIEQLRHVLGVLDLSAGWGTANTALVYQAGRLLALHEGDQAYEMHVHGDGRLQTLGRRHVGGVNDKAWFTAHPKVDPKTGAMYAFGYSLFWRPFATYYRIDPDGRQTDMVPLDLDYPTMLHDFGLTQHHAVFIQTSMRFRLLHCLRPGKSVFAYDDKAPLRFLVLPRNATSASQGRWFDLPPGVVFHVATAWEESNGSIIRLYVIRFERPFELNVDWMQFSMENAKPQELDDMGAHLWEVVLDLTSGQATQRRLMSSVPQTCEFPQVHPGHVGSKARYVYCTLFYGNGRMQAFAKIDLDLAGEDEAASVRIIEVEEGAGGGEVAFVPRHGAEEEDDGYLLLYVHNDYTNESELRVYDAKTMSPVPVSRVPLPQRVPYGFHGTFISRDALRAQRPLAPELYTPDAPETWKLRTGRGRGEGGSIDLTQGKSPRSDSLDRLSEMAASWWHAAQVKSARKQVV